MDFMIMLIIVNMLSAMVVVLNSVGLEMYSKLCRESGDISPNKQDWVGDCGTYDTADTTFNLDRI